MVCRMCGGKYLKMEYKCISDREIIYTGEQLRSHWIYENFDILGDTVVSFVGEVKVDITHMVDIQDVKALAPIYSSKMLSFIVEHFGATIKETILRQRIFICIIQEYLNQVINEGRVERSGDDLFYKGGKLSVSIATISPLSGLIHIGINIDSKNAPVKASGLLSEMNINNVNNLALELMKRYTIEHQQITNASFKVKPVV